MSGDCFHGELGPAKEDGVGKKGVRGCICVFRESKREDGGTSVTPGALTVFALT